MVVEEFYRRTIKLGNSAGVLLPKSVLGSDVKVTIIHHPHNIKKEVLSVLNPILDNVIGIFLIKNENRRFESLVVSNNINRHIERGNFFVDIVSIDRIKKSIKEKKDTREKILKARPILNKTLLEELKRI